MNSFGDIQQLKMGLMKLAKSYDMTSRNVHKLLQRERQFTIACLRMSFKVPQMQSRNK